MYENYKESNENKSFCVALNQERYVINDIANTLKYENFPNFIKGCGYLGLKKYYNERSLV